MTPRFIRTPTGIIRYDNNFTDIEKIKLENIENGAQVNTILGIKGSNEDNFRIGYIIITKDNIGLGSVDNTPDNEKNVLSATRLTTGRDITIGNQTVNFDGSENIEYSLSEIGAVNKAGDTITGDIILSDGAGLTVDGAVLLKSTLSVDEKTMLKDILEVSGATTLKDTLAVTGNTTIGGTISVTGDSTLSNLNITGNNTISGTLDVTGKTTLNNELVSNGAVTLKDILSVTGNTTIGGTIYVSGDSTLNGILTVVGDSSLSTLTTSGLATLNELNVAKGANILGNAAISGGLVVKGNSSFSTISTSGKATLNSLEVIGALSIGSDLSISGALTVAGKTTLNGYTTINRLEVSNDITANSLIINAKDFGSLDPAVVINGNLTAVQVGGTTIAGNKVIAGESFELSTGEANFIGNVNIEGIANITTLQVSESAEFNCGVDMYGIVTIEGALKVNADADLKNLNVTDETIVNTLKVNSTAVVDGEYLKVRGNLIIESGDASIDYNLTVGQTIKTKNLTVSNVLTSNNVINLATNKYTDQYNYGAMDAGNSNIYNVNQIQFGDLCENAAEGIQFYNTSTTVDSLWAKSGVLYFTPNRTWGNAGTDTIVLTSSNYKKYVTTESHTHYSISTKSDDRNVDTKPNDYNNKIVFSGLKSTSKIGYPSTPTGYAYVVGLRGWGDNSGGYAWEVGFSNSGIFVRNGETTSWNPWYRIYTSADKPTKADIGLGNVDNTADSTKSVKYATSAGSANAVTWNNVTSKPSTFTPASHTHDYLTIYGNRPTSADFAPGTNGAGSMFHFVASSNMTTGKPPQEGNILQMNWDYTNGYDTQLALSNDNPIADMYIRNQRNGTWGSWSTVLSSSNYTKYAAAKDHTHNYAAKSHTHEYIANSSDTCKLYFNNSDEVNFGGSSTSTNIYFGYRATDGRPKPSVYCFGTGTSISYGNTTLPIGTATIKCENLKCRYIDAVCYYINGKSIDYQTISWRTPDTKTSVGNLGYTNDSESAKRAPTISTLVYWNGRYNATRSNLRYCWEGQMTYSPDGAITCFRSGGSYLEVTANGIAYGCSWWQSDTKLKTNIEETNVNDALTKLSSIDFIQYDWKESYIKDRPHIKLGLSANQVETIIPEAVMNIEQPEENEYDVIKQLDSTVLITYSMKAIVELNNKLNDKVEKLEKRIKELETAKN